MDDKKSELVDFPILSRKYKTLLTVKYANRKPYVSPNPNEIVSHIPGTIIKVKAKVGARLKEGDTVLVLEAMKMMNQVKMPFTGKIKEIQVAEGQKIPKGTVMIVIE
jgi:biotin carboxyl carrier protein